MVLRGIRNRVLTVVVLASLFGVAACGDRSDDPAGTGGEEAAGTHAPSPSDSGPDRIELSQERWYAREDSAGQLGVRSLALIENTSDVVVEVSVDVEAVDADGESLGRSGPQPFGDFLEPGQKLPVGLADRVSGEPADVLPDVVVMDVADFKQERYGHIRFTADLREVDVREDEIVVETEITNTGDQPAQSLYYLAAFDASDAIVVAGPAGWIPSMLGVGESVVLEGFIGRDSSVDLEVDRAEVYFPANASMDAS